MTSNLNFVVSVFLLVNLALIGVIDVVQIVRVGWDGTVTHVIREWSRQWPALPFLAGCLAGHLFLN